MVFAIGSAHYVTPLKGEVMKDSRQVVTGWPYATKDLIESLNQNCNFNHYFDSEEYKKPIEQCH